MLSAFGSITKNLSLKPKLRTIDNIVFKLHYRVTFVLLVVCTVLVSSRQYIGDHIRCVSDVGGVESGVIETYCFFSSTFTVVKHLEGKDGVSRLHPGVGPHLHGEDEVRRHAYYQWVPFFLFFQAVMFYLPHLLWRKLDGGVLFVMTNVLRGCALASEDNDVQVNAERRIPTKRERDARIDEVSSVFLDRLPYLNRWAPYLVLCEALNLVNVVAQVFLTDIFLAGRFLTLGHQLVIGPRDDGTGVLDVVFPKMTKCDFRKYGPSGTLQNYDALCVLALNIVNEKIYAVLWFWYMSLGCATVLGLFWRVLTLCLHGRSARFNAMLFRCVSAGAVDKKTVDIVTSYLTFSQWLFLYYLGKNMDGFVFNRLLVSVARKLYHNRLHSYPHYEEEEGEEQDNEAGQENEELLQAEAQNSQIISDSA